MVPAELLLAFILKFYASHYSDTADVYSRPRHTPKSIAVSTQTDFALVIVGIDQSKLRINLD